MGIFIYHLFYISNGYGDVNEIDTPIKIELLMDVYYAYVIQPLAIRLDLDYS